MLAGPTERPSPKPFRVQPVSYRPLALVSGLSFGDYLLWNWSLNTNHDVLALISGLSLPPLALAWAWLLALSLIRLLGRSSRRSRRAAVLAGPDAGEDRDASEAKRAAAATTAAGAGRDGSASPGSPPSSSGKLAA
jgi:hypothetical protein